MVEELDSQSVEVDNHFAGVDRHLAGIDNRRLGEVGIHPARSVKFDNCP